ncbi:hypothetical protein Osc7112_4165 [Oscillatoria nigro-viridis PCC 7112]|uniref:Uncharacterized protein n=1 Tax=Phormidium nigroviride PCC 7112 TaxID=179408 RepID=K9VLS1_9CYAN|nr:hypothetical protein [Oscillatoria nigro-viridis]AFZ08489.1 hypothetical protein Osc7112_4165 [Oscillatoria nigro-viridis PCC 7112]
MHVTTGGTQSKNIIGQRYEVLPTPAQTQYRHTLASGTPSLKIEVSIESPISGEWFGQFNQNTIAWVKCLTLLNLLFTNTPEGLEEASEVLERMVEYYSDCRSDLGQTTLPQELGLLTGSVLPSEVRPPLVLDFE